MDDWWSSSRPTPRGAPRRHPNHIGASRRPLIAVNEWSNDMRNKTIPALGAAAALAAMLALPVVAGGQDASPEAMAETAKVRVGHFSPDAPPVDVYANGDAILTEVPFGVLSDYLEVPGGTYTIEVVAAGQDPADGAVIGPVDLDFAAGTATTVAATNALASIEAQVIADAPAPQDGGAQVRVVHFSADAPAVDVAADGGDVVVENLAYPTATEYLDLAAGEYDLEVRPTGTTDVAFDIDPVTLDAGTSYSVFAIGSLADGSFMVLPAVDAMVMADAMADDEAMAEASPAS
jgi:hypothetical protein